MSALHTPGAVEGSAAQQDGLAAMRAEGLEPYSWQNDPGYVYPPHQHPYHKVLYCARGSIRFDLPGEGRSVQMTAGDRLDLPAGTAHGAVVGPDGVLCLEATR
ncbi:MAG: cupin domain-containing protein [Chloroflexota bacterium]